MRRLEYDPSKQSALKWPQKVSIGNEKGEKILLSDLSPSNENLSYSKSGIDEFDRVLGKGLVSSAAILLSGDPGIGKSTILLQAAARFGEAGLKVLYISGEEAASQVKAQNVWVYQLPLSN